MNKKTIVINIFGGPGAGKSIMAADIFVKLKMEKISSELVREYAKKLVWSDKLHILNDQIYVFAKQNHDLFNLIGKVDVIVSDAPLINSIYYDKSNSETFENLVAEEFEKYENINYFLERRSDEYEQEGRYHDLEEAKQIDNDVENILYKHNIPYKKIKISENTLDDILDDIQVKLSNNQ